MAPEHSAVVLSDPRDTADAANLTRPDAIRYFHSSHESLPFLSDNRLEPRYPGLCRTGLRELTATSFETSTQTGGR